MFWLNNLNKCINDFTDIHCKAMVKLGIMLEEKTTLGCIWGSKEFQYILQTISNKKKIRGLDTLCMQIVCVLVKRS